MATNLYEVLGISRNATSEEVRKAYRRKALETHPDRLPQGASAADKSTSEDLFRKVCTHPRCPTIYCSSMPRRQVNNAYEVLSDSQSRAIYDQHGVWPPPEPAPQRPFANGAHNTFSDPFYRDPFRQNPFSRGPRMNHFGGFGFGSQPGPTGFTDPFVLFNSIFGDIHRAFEVDPFFDDTFGRHGFGSNHFGGSFLNSGFHPMAPSPFDFGGGSMLGSSMHSFSNGGSGGRWVSESWTSSNVNGVTHTKCVRKDSEGNEHITYRFPDGTERRTINGVEQSTSQLQRALPPSAPPAPHPTHAVTIPPPPPPYSEAVAQPPLRSRSTRHHGHYDDYPSDRREHRDRHRHEHSSRDKERDRGRENENERGGHGNRDDGHGYDPQNSFVLEVLEALRRD
ncbi:hypothetical protein J3R82DRAFT_2371 [Butyriboletus roseoflavus]|nr:hypothetical protein J3R82DRAFT_2371 [Butyriboletus roseoflavus]